MIHSWIFVCAAGNKNLFGLERNQQELEIITAKKLEIIFWGNELD